jgi:AICAR transformylase/IMP cyclohydrolase PurH
MVKYHHRTWRLACCAVKHGNPSGEAERVHEMPFHVWDEAADAVLGLVGTTGRAIT